jgi:hypothetical protein
MTAVDVRREEAALLQRVQAPPGTRSSRKQPSLACEITRESVGKTALATSHNCMI